MSHDGRTDAFIRSLPEQVSEFFIGLDLGQSLDYTALGILERTAFPRGFYLTKKRPRYGVRHLQRWPLGTSYPAIVADVSKMLSAVDGRGVRPLANASLIVDNSGVGRAVVDMFRADGTIKQLVAITITAGASAHYDEMAHCWRCAKKELVAVLHATAQTGRLHFATGLKEEAALRRELATFQERITPAGNLTYESWREQEHDDMILALACALWYAERHPFVIARPFEPVVVGGKVPIGAENLPAFAQVDSRLLPGCREGYEAPPRPPWHHGERR